MWKLGAMMNTPRLPLMGYVLIGLMCAIATFLVTKLVYQSKLDATNLSHQLALNLVTAQAFLDTTEKLHRQQKAQKTLQELNNQYSKDLENERNESQRLRDDLFNERRRVQFASADLATCELTGTYLTGAGGMGDASPVGLTRKGGLLVHDIRRGIKEDRAKITYLQRYITDVVKQCKVKE